MPRLQNFLEMVHSTLPRPDRGAKRHPRSTPWRRQAARISRHATASSEAEWQTCRPSGDQGISSSDVAHQARRPEGRIPDIRLCGSEGGPRPIEAAKPWSSMIAGTPAPAPRRSRTTLSPTDITAFARARMPRGTAHVRAVPREQIRLIITLCSRPPPRLSTPLSSPPISEISTSLKRKYDERHPHEDQPKGDMSGPIVE